MSSGFRIVNTAPLIFLSNIKKLELLRIGVDTVYAPAAVLSELKAVQDEALKTAKKNTVNPTCRLYVLSGVFLPAYPLGELDNLICRFAPTAFAYRRIVDNLTSSA